MGWIEILTIILTNAPAAIQTVEEGIAWATKTWGETQAAIGKPADQITREELLAHFNQVGNSSAVIQDIT
jgi:hypothetical protein